MDMATPPSERERIMNVNYSILEERLARFVPFNGNSMSGAWDDDVFFVYSYSTIIASHHSKDDTRFLNSKKYSATTTRHQNIVRRAWGDVIEF